MRFAVEVKTRGERCFVGNQLRFETVEKAKEYAADLAHRWTLVEDWQVRDTEEDRIVFTTEHDGDV